MSNLKFNSFASALKAFSFDEELLMQSGKYRAIKEELTMVTEDIEGLGFSMTDLYDDRSLLEEVIACLQYKQSQLKEQLHKERRFLKFILKRIIDKLSKTKSNNLIVVEYKILNDKYCRHRFVYSRYIMSRFSFMIKQRRLMAMRRAETRLERQAHIRSLRYNYSVLSVDPCLEGVNYSDIEYESVSDSELEIQARKDKIRYKSRFSSQLRDSDCIDEEFEIVRNPNLLLRLKTVLLAFRTRRMRGTLSEQLKYVCDNIFNLVKQPVEEAMEMTEMAVPQMDSHGENLPSTSTAGNVTLTENRVESRDVLNTSRHNWCNYVSSDIVGSYNEMTDRWLKIRTFKWSKNDQPSTIVTFDGNPKNNNPITLPLDIISNTEWNMCDMPNTIPFKVHRYWRGDIEVKIQVNSNKFQIGQLQCSWFYQPDVDSKFSLRENIYSSSQTNHILINASASNEASMYISFKHHLPMLPTKSRADVRDVLDLGKLYIRVLTPLSVTSNGPSECTGAVFVRFVNNEFTGQISGAFPQMDKIALSAAESLFHSLVRSPNEDNPSLVTPPRYLVPTASHSWAQGTNIVEPLHSLRLDARGKTNHPDNPPDEETVSYCTSIFGLVKANLEWSKNYDQGYLLWSCDASPMLDKSSYVSTSSTDKRTLTTYYIPPVAVVSSLFNYWRGGLEFRFDIIASQFHTGRVVVGYVPGALSTDKVELKHVLAGPHMVFSLQEMQQFSYIVPYIANKPYWSRRYLGNYIRDQSYAPSRVYMFILNPLIPMESVYDKVYINVYMRGSTDFEVSIPVQPSIGLGFNTNVIYSDSEIVHAIPGYDPYYAGFWQSFNGSASLIMRYGQTANQIAEFDPKYLNVMRVQITKSLPWKYYYYEIEDVLKAPKYKNSDGELVPVRYGVMCYPTATNFAYGYMIPIETEDKAIACGLAVLKAISTKTNSLAACSDYAIPSSPGTTANTFCQGHLGFIPKEQYYNPVTDFEMITVQGERDAAEMPIQVKYGFSSTSYGMSFYGENFSRLSDLCRRYQAYAAFSVDLSVITHPGQCCYILPILPQGLDLNLGSVSTPYELINRCRDGHIPIISSAYRYFRGSIRIRLIVPPDSAIVWVQHRPDRKMRQLIPIKCSEVITAEAVANHSYAYYIQDASVNSIIEIEIPFYQNSAYGLLQRPLLKDSDCDFYFGLGELSIGFMTSQFKKKDFSKFLCSVYYSFGDDMQLSTFQGFPPVVLLDDISDAAVPQMGWWDKMVQKTKENIKEEAGEVISEQITKATEGVEDQLEQIKTMLSETSLKDMFTSSFFRLFISQILHVIANYNYKALAIAISTILLELGILCLETCVKFIDMCIRFLQSMQPKKAKEQTEAEGAEEAAEQVVYQGDFEGDAETGVLTFLWAGMCSLVSALGRGKKMFTDMKEFKGFLTVDMKNSVTSANAVFTFLKNIFSVLDAMKRKILGIIRPDYKMLIKFDDQYEEIAAWCNEVIYLSDPHNLERFKTNIDYQNRVSIAYAQGSVYYRQIACVDVKRVADCIIKFFERIENVRKEIVRIGSDGIARREPFVIWQYGEPGVGKSTITTNIITEILKHRKITSDVPPIYNHNAAKEFWDGCNNNPAMVVDDLFNVQQGELWERHLALLFTVVSPVVLCPPQARLEDKQKTYNPHIFFINSNYLAVRSGGVNEAAIHRRRDIVLHTALYDAKDFENDPTLKKKNCVHCEKNQSIKDASVEDLQDFHHLKFRYTFQVLNCDKEDNFTPWMPYNKLISNLKIIADRIMDKNEKMYIQRCKDLQCLISNEAVNPFDNVMSLEDIRARCLAERRKLIDESYVQQLKKLYTDVSSECKKVVENVFKKGFNMIMQRKDKDILEAVCSPDVPISPEEMLDMLLAEQEIINPQFDATTSYTYSYPKIKIYDNKFDVEFKKILEDEKNAKVPSDLVSVLYASCKLNGVPLTNVANFIRICYEQTHEYPNSGVLFEMIKYLYPDCRHYSYLDSYIWNESDFTYKTSDDVLYTLTSLCGCIKNCVCVREKIKNPDYNCRCHCHGSANEERMYHACATDDPMLFTMMLDRLLKRYPHIGIRSLINRPYAQRDLPEYLRYEPNLVLPPPDKWKDSLDKAKEIIIASVFAICKGFCKLFTLIGKFLPYLVIIFSCIGVVSATVMHVKMAWLDEDGINSYMKINRHLYPNISPQSNNVYGMPNNVNLPKPVPVARPNPQSGVQQLSVALIRVQRNMFRITAVVGCKRLSCVGVVLYDRKLLLLRHYLEEFDQYGDQVEYYGDFLYRKEHDGTFGLNFNFKSCNVVYYNVPIEDGSFGSNYVLVDLPLKFPQCKTLLPFIAKNKEHSLVSGEGMLVDSKGCVHDSLTINREDKAIAINETATTSKVTLKSVYTYRVQGRGMCGSILLAKNLERPIIGIHVAGVEYGNVRGIAEVLCYETFCDSNIEGINDVGETFVIPDLEPEQFAEKYDNIKTMIFREGTVSNQFAIYQSPKTQYIPSLVAGTFPVTTEPAPLTGSDKRLPKGADPYSAGIDNFGKPPKDFEKELLDEAEFDLKRVIVANAKPVRAKVGVLDFKTAIIGDPSIPFFNPLEWSTSAGFPLTQLNKQYQGGKKCYFNMKMNEKSQYELISIDNKLVEIIRMNDALRKRNIKPFTVFTDCLKDDVLPSEKCMILGKTRVFSISPLEFTITFRRYFNDFIAAYQVNRLKCEHGIGINVTSREWSDVASLLVSKGPNIVCGDYKNFGPGLMKEAARRAFEIIFSWYDHYGDGENNNYRKVLASEILDAFHIMNNLIYTTPCGIPSGSPITTPLNSLVNSLYLRCAWKKITNLDFVSMHENISILTYGDDVCISVSDSFKNVYNTATLALFFSKYDIVFTDIDKSGNIVPYRDLFSASFLKHGFGVHPNMPDVFLPLLDKRSIESCTNWIRRKGDPRMNTKVNCETAIRLAHGWGEKYYNSVIEKMIRACATLEIPALTYYSWSELSNLLYVREWKENEPRPWFTRGIGDVWQP